MGRPPATSSAQRPGREAARVTGLRPPPARPQSCASIPVNVRLDPEPTVPAATEAAAAAGAAKGGGYPAAHPASWGAR